MPSGEKYAVVTGNERGIGRALTIDLASQGYNVIVAWFESEEDGKEVVAECVKLGVQAYLTYHDVRDMQSVIDLKNFAIEKLGTNLAVFINNAGMSIAGTLVDQDPADYNTVISTDLIGSMNCAHVFAPLMIENGEGRLINIGSCSGIRSTAGNNAYGIAKAGIMGLTRGLALELGKYAITVNNICPGYINTKRSAEFCGPEMIESIKKSTALNSIGIEQDIVEAMNFFLRSPRVTGQSVMVNGGSVMN
ncbi:SDR family oxidoreductase [Actinomycetota bacterium]|nr:SDR family oxidoreductase [Actinomycetota bacterium]